MHRGFTMEKSRLAQLTPVLMAHGRQYVPFPPPATRAVSRHALKGAGIAATQEEVVVADNPVDGSTG